MRYPVNRFKEDFNMTAGYGFGAVTSYGRHDGIDINKNGGGDIELGEPIYAIADGELVYYHTGRHPTTGFGYHNVYKINGPWGTRWVHSAHCLSDLLATVKTVKEGEQIGRIGKSGTQYAHDHFSIFKVDPATLRNGIDTIATNDTELNAWWEDPIKFIEKWMNVQPQPDFKALYEQTKREKDAMQIEFDKTKILLAQAQDKVKELKKQVQDVLNKY